MASINKIAIKKTIRQMYAKFKLIRPNNRNPDKYLSLLCYPEGPSIWNKPWDYLRSRS